MNLKKEVKNLRGETIQMSFPSNADIEKVKKEKGIETVTVKDLPRETIENVLINCLANYVVEDKKQVFAIHKAADIVMIGQGKEDVEVPESVRNFLVEFVLPASTIRVEKDILTDGKTDKKEKGMYAAWIIAQVYTELGVNE